MNQCQGTTKSGNQCKSIGLVKGTEFCMVHAPALRDKMQEAKTKGGKTLNGKKKINTINNFRKYMENFITHDMPTATPQMISAVAKMSESYTKMVEKSELEAKVDKLVAQAGYKK